MSDTSLEKLEAIREHLASPNEAESTEYLIAASYVRKMVERRMINPESNLNDVRIFLMKELEILLEPIRHFSSNGKSA